MLRLPHALAALLIALPLPASAAMTLQGDSIRIGYDDAGLWNRADTAEGLQIRDGAGAWVDLTWPLTPWQVVSFAFTHGTVDHTYMGSTELQSHDWVVLAAENLSTGSMNIARHTWQAGPLEVIKTESWHDTSRSVAVHWVVTNTSSTAISDLRFMHAHDPDQDVVLYGEYETWNDAVDVIPDGILDWAESEGAASGWTAGYGLCDEGSQIAGHAPWIGGPVEKWSTDPDTPLYDMNVTLDDSSMNLRAVVGGLSAGEQATFGFVFAWNTTWSSAESTYASDRAAACAVCDEDGDGVAVELCGGGDCDDNDPSTFPGAFDAPGDGIDADCDGIDPSITVCFVDGDGDGYGSAATLTSADADCDDPGESDLSSDCNDFAAGTHPGAPELCDSVDSDCDGSLVDGFVDTDGDGAPNCTDPDDDNDSVADAADCAPLDASISPLAFDVPGDGVDQDCDGADASDTECFVDADGDGYGGPTTILSTDADCGDPGESPVSSDCDDVDPSVHPNAVESCDGLDSDCDGTLLDGFPDWDNDGTPDCIDDDDDGDGDPDARDSDDFNQ